MLERLPYVSHEPSPIRLRISAGDLPRRRLDHSAGKLCITRCAAPVARRTDDVCDHHPRRPQHQFRARFRDFHHRLSEYSQQQPRGLPQGNPNDTRRQGRDHDGNRPAGASRPRRTIPPLRPWLPPTNDYSDARRYRKARPTDASALTPGLGEVPTVVIGPGEMGTGAPNR
jgi:hypothetical protein